MIEKCLLQIVAELGASGVLLIGLYYILLKVARIIAGHLWQINHNTTEMAKCLHEITKKYLEQE